MKAFDATNDLHFNSTGSGSRKVIEIPLAPERLGTGAPMTEYSSVVDALRRNHAYSDDMTMAADVGVTNGGGGGIHTATSFDHDPSLFGSASAGGGSHYGVGPLSGLGYSDTEDLSGGLPLTGSKATVHALQTLQVSSTKMLKSSLPCTFGLISK